MLLLRNPHPWCFDGLTYYMLIWTSFIIMVLNKVSSGAYVSELLPEQKDAADRLLEQDFSSPPFQRTGNRTDVNVVVVLSGIRVVPESERQTESEMYLYQLWSDPRLTFNASHDTDFHVVRPKFWNNLWLGETYLEGMVSNRIQDPTMPNKFVWVFPNGTLAVAMRLAVLMVCDMNVFQFPFANYRCQLKIRVHSYLQNDLELYWDTREPIRFADDFESDNVKLLGTHYGICKNKGSEVLDSACLHLEILLQKDYSSSILRVYIPSIFIVFVGWLSFWIDRGEVSARVKLGTLCVLAMITDQVGQNFASPSKSAVTSIEVWYVVCLTFVTAVMVEFTVVHAIDSYKERLDKIAKKRKERQLKEKAKKGLKDTTANGGIETKNSESSNSVESKESLDIFLGEIKEEEEELEEDFPCMFSFLASLSAGTIEKWARIVYAVAFLLFQLLYWLIFLHASEAV